MSFTNYSDTASLLARIEALELALFGRLTNLPANTVLGSVAGGNANALSAAQARSLLGVPSNTDASESTNTTSGGAVFAGGVGIAGNLNVGGFIGLGDNVKIKVKYLTGTTAAVQGDAVIVPHYLDASKIIAVLAAVEYAANQYIGPGYTGGYFYNVSWSTTVNIVNKAGDSANILSKPCRWTIFYKD